jgi:hypothetical protein
MSLHEVIESEEEWQIPLRPIRQPRHWKHRVHGSMSALLRHCLRMSQNEIQQ